MALTITRIVSNLTHPYVVHTQGTVMRPCFWRGKKVEKGRRASDLV
jgi:hypothetical protein